MSPNNSVNSLSPNDIKAVIETSPGCVLLDVRQAWEYDHAKIAGSTLIPLHELPSQIEQLNLDAKTICICHHGMRSLQAAHFLLNSGFKEIYNLDGGIDAWSLNVDPSIPRY